MFTFMKLTRPDKSSRLTNGEETLFANSRRAVVSNGPRYVGVVSSKTLKTVTNGGAVVSTVLINGDSAIDPTKKRPDSSCLARELMILNDESSFRECVSTINGRSKVFRTSNSCPSSSMIGFRTRFKTWETILRPARLISSDSAKQWLGWKHTTMLSVNHDNASIFGDRRFELSEKTRLPLMRRSLHPLSSRIRKHRLVTS